MTGDRDLGERRPRGAGGSTDGVSSPAADRNRMYPLPETAEALDELDPGVVDDDLLEQLIEASGRVRDLVPCCVGVSLTLQNEEVTFTLVASDVQVAMLDSIQYLAGGPCVDAVIGGNVISLHTRERLDWPLFADASRRFGVASTLSLPLRDNGRGAAGVNLYGATVDCFDGHHEELADIFGALADEAVANADLAFATQVAAREAPRRLREGVTLGVAEGLVASTLGLTTDQARERLIDAAQRAGISTALIARLAIALLNDRAEQWADPR